MKNLKVLMKHNLTEIPHYEFPTNYQLQSFKQGDEKEWARIETATGEFDSEEQALERFTEEFQPYIDDFQKRSLFLINEAGEKIGTITAWYGNHKSDTIGRLHWVAIIPEYQGKGLAKPMLSSAMKLLAQFHDEAYLTSQTTSYPAINLYLNFGFQPVIEKESDTVAWDLLEEKLNRKILSH